MSSSTSKRKRRKNSPMSASKRRRDYVCSGCGFAFASKEELLTHKVSSHDLAECKIDLYTCNHCQNSFLTSLGLSMHETRSVLCMRAKMLPDIVNTIEFCPNNSDSNVDLNGDLDEFSHDDYTNTPHWNNGDEPEEEPLERFVSIEHLNMNVVRNDNRDLYPPKVSTTHSLLNSDLIKQTLKKAPSPFMKQSTLDFKNSCEENNKQLSIDIKVISRTRSLSSREYLIIECFTHTSFNAPDFKGTLFDALQQFWNNCYLVPSMMECSNTQIVEEDVIQFLELYSTFPETNVIRFDHNDDNSFIMNENDNVGDLSVNTMPVDNLVDAEVFQEEHQEEGVLGNTSNVSSDLKHFQDVIIDTRNNAVFNNSDIAKVELYNMLSKANCPKYLFEQIQRWAIRFSSDMIGSLPSHRNTFINEIGNKVYGKEVFEVMKPKVTNLVLPRGATIPVVTFSIKGAITSLLTNANLMRKENLLINSSIPFQTSKVPNILSDINSGWWFYETHKKFCKNDNDILLPIILFIDGSNVDKNHRLSVEPVTVTLGIFNRSTRNLSEAWRSIGFVENFMNKTTDDVKPSRHPSAKLQEYHAVLDHILSEIQYIQGKDSGFHWCLTLDNEVHDVVFKVAVQVIIGDCKGNDSLCGRFGSHSKNSRGFCRDCKVTYEESDDTKHKCVFIEKSDICGQSKEYLNSIGFHKINNAFDTIDFGAHDMGVYGATPSEPLHAFKLGLCKYLFESFMVKVPPKANKMMDKRLTNMITRESVSKFGDLPSISVLRNGLEGFPSMTADDQFSRIFGIFICLLHPCILKSFASDNRYIRHEEKGHPVSVGAMEDKAAFGFFDLLEETVIYYSWLYSEQHHMKDILNTSKYEEFIKFQGSNENEGCDLNSMASSANEGTVDIFSLLEREIETSSKEGDESISQRSVRRYLYKFKTVAQRSNGNQLKLVKFHQQLHNVREILKDGSLLNIDGGRCESIAIANLKKPGSLSQRRVKSLNKQIAHNLLCDQVVVDATILANMNTGVSDDPEDTTQTCFGSKFSIRLDEPESSFNPGVDNIPILVQWNGKEYRDLHEKNLCNAVAKRLFANIEEGGCLHRSSTVVGFTEYKLDDKVLRAHPCYRGERPWFDWALIKWEGITELVPAKLCMFLDLSNCRLMNVEEHNEFKAMFGDINYDDDSESETRRPTYHYLSRSKWVVIQSCITKEEEGICPKNPYQIHSKICTRYYLEKKWRILPIESIIETAVCIHVTDDGNDIVHIHNKSEWKKHFLQ